MDGIRITYPTEQDWPWIIEQHAATAWASLTAELQRSVTIQAVQESLAGQTETYRASHGETNQVFIAHTGAGLRVGFVWVGQVRRAFTGEMQGHILNLFVADEFRGKGAGAQLMTQAETWAREHHMGRIGLNVAAHNSAAIGLYEKLGYGIETQRMVKNLGEVHEGKKDAA